MTRPLSPQFLVPLSVATTLLSAASGLADMIPVTDGRYVSARATYQGVSQEARYDADFFLPFDATSNPGVTLTAPCEGDPQSECTLGECAGWAHQLSQFFPNGLSFSGEADGRWGGEPSGDYEFDSTFRLRFRLDTVHRYNFFWQIDQGDWPTIGLTRGYIRLEGPETYLAIHQLTSGVLADSGFLGPGEYVIEARSWGGSYEQNWQGAVYAGQFICIPDTLPTLPYQPNDQVVGLGGTATFSAGGSCPTGTPTYQWRRNFVPLSNGGNISGATGPNLSIQNASASDSGYYDVIVTCGTIQTPSRLVHLGIVLTTAVVAEAVVPAHPVTLRAPMPNPFGSATSMSYTASRPVRITAEVYNAQGARVRSLVDGIASGSGTIAWNGETSSGRRAPAGIYFVRVEAGGVREMRKVVLLR